MQSEGRRLVGLMVISSAFAIISAAVDSSIYVSLIFIGIFILGCVLAVLYPIKGRDKNEDRT